MLSKPCISPKNISITALIITTADAEAANATSINDAAYAWRNDSISVSNLFSLSVIVDTVSTLGSKAIIYVAGGGVGKQRSMADAALLW